MFCVISIASFLHQCLFGFSGEKKFDLSPSTSVVTYGCPASELEYVAKKISGCSAHLNPDFCVFDMSIKPGKYASLNLRVCIFTRYPFLKPGIEVETHPLLRGLIGTVFNSAGCAAS